MTARIAVSFAALALVAAACQGDTQTRHDEVADSHADGEQHEHLELDEVPEGQQAYQLKDGRTGWRRVPLIDVSGTEFIDFGSNGAGERFIPIASPGEILLLFFGYTSCPDVCPTTLADYSVAFDSMPSELTERIAFGMISIDPERDDADQIDQYVSLFIDDGHALLASDQSALASAVETFGVQYEIEEHEAGAIDYLVGHTATVFAIDEKGEIIWEIGYPTPPDDIAAALTDLFDERY